MKRIYNYWTKKEIGYLKNNYKNLDIKTLEKDLNHSGNAIKSKASNLNLFPIFGSTSNISLNLYSALSTGDQSDWGGTYLSSKLSRL